MLVYVKHVGPWAGPFLAQGPHNLNNLGRDPLDEATYQISKTWAFWFSEKKIFKGFPYI